MSYITSSTYCKNELDFIFNTICEENDIEYPDFLKRCIKNIISNTENRYLSYCEYEYQCAQFDIENIDYYKPGLYENVEYYKNEYLDALDQDLNDKIEIILGYYSKFVDFLKNNTSEDITSYIFSYT